MAAPKDPLLALASGSDPDCISIDGERYPLADETEWTMAQAVAMRRRGKLLQEAAGREDLSEDEARAVDEALEEIFRAVAPGVPAEVAARLSAAKKARVIEVFFRRAADRAAARAQTISPSSPASSVSTADPSENG